MFDAYTGQELSDTELSERFDSYLDETYPEVEVVGITFSPSRVLQEVDPIAYRTEQSNWESYMIENGDFTEDAPEEEDEDEDDEDDNEDDD